MFARLFRCGPCRGRGWVSWRDPVYEALSVVRCPACHGRGQVSLVRSLAWRGRRLFWRVYERSVLVTRQLRRHA